MVTHNVEALPSEIVVVNALEHPPTEKQFDVLKEAILSRLDRSDNAKLRDLLNNVSMGDRTPSQLLRLTKSLLGRRHMDESIMRPALVRKVTTSNDAHPNGLLRREDAVTARRTRR